MQTKNKYSMHVLFKEVFSTTYAALYLSSNSVSVRTEGGIVKQKVGRGEKVAKMWGYPLWMARNIAFCTGLAVDVERS